MAYWALAYFICGGIFRRILGTEFRIHGVKISRFWKILFLILMAMSMYWVNGIFPTDKKSWLMMAWAIGWFMRYNNHTHGDYFNLLDESKDEARSWWVDKCLQLIFGKDKYYNFSGNFVGLTLGYLVPAILASLTMQYHWFWVAGFTASLCYAICELTLKFTGRPTNFAEYLHGALMMLIFYLNVGC